MDLYGGRFRQGKGECKTYFFADRRNYFFGFGNYGAVGKSNGKVGTAVIVVIRVAYFDIRRKSVVACGESECFLINSVFDGGGSIRQNFERAEGVF